MMEIHIEIGKNLALVSSLAIWFWFLKKVLLKE